MHSIVENYQHYLHGCGLLGSEVSGCKNSHATEVKCSNIHQKKLHFIRKSCKMTIKAAKNQEYPGLIFRFPAETILLSKFYYTTDVVRGFLVQIF
jgi:hypothetical protein